MNCLALVQDYESEPEAEVELDSEDDHSPPSPAAVSQTEIEEDDVEQGPHSSLLPSPLDVFAEITGPPAFLKHCVDQPQAAQQARKAEAVSVVQAKPILVVNSGNGIEKKEDVSSDESSRVLRAHNPSAQDAAELLRMCVQCGVPKTFSEAKGMVCPVCRDHPRKEVADVDKKRIPKVKDREKGKRMRGQSSHATWKSETEMHLRQQFD